MSFLILGALGIPKNYKNFKKKIKSFNYGIMEK